MAIPGLRRAMKRSMIQRECFVCGVVIPEGKGCWESDLGIIVHMPACNDVVKPLRKDYSKSAKGRWRPGSAVLRDLYERRLALPVTTASTSL